MIMIIWDCRKVLMLQTGISNNSPLLTADDGTRLTLAKGETVFLADDPTRGIFLIKSGQVRLVRHAIDGGDVTLHVAGAGETFAEASLFADRYHCDAIAEKPTTLLHFAKGHVLDLLGSDPTRALAWIKHLSEQVQRLRGQTALLSLKKAQQRLLGYLRIRASDSCTLVIDRPWKMIASELGLTHEAVYRALAELERQGLIRRDRKSSMIELQDNQSL